MVTASASMPSIVNDHIIVEMSPGTRHNDIVVTRCDRAANKEFVGFWRSFKGPEDGRHVTRRQFMGERLHMLHQGLEEARV